MQAGPRDHVPLPHLHRPAQAHQSGKWRPHMEAGTRCCPQDVAGEAGPMKTANAKASTGQLTTCFKHDLMQWNSRPLIRTSQTFAHDPHYIHMGTQAHTHVTNRVSYGLSLTLWCMLRDSCSTPFLECPTTLIQGPICGSRLQLDGTAEDWSRPALGAWWCLQSSGRPEKSPPPQR